MTRWESNPRPFKTVLFRRSTSTSPPAHLAASSAFPERIYKFNESGASTAFGALGSNTVISPQSFGYYGDFEIDNSGTASQGQFYASPEYGPIHAYLQSGAPIEGGGYPIEGTGDVCGAAVGPNGHFWRDKYNQGIIEYDATGIETGTVVNPSPGSYCDFDMDSQGNFYTLAPYYSAAVLKYSPTGEYLAKSIPVPPLRSRSTYRMTTFTSTRATASNTTRLSEGSWIPSVSRRTFVSRTQQLARDRCQRNTHTVYAANNRRPSTIDSFLPTGRSDSDGYHRRSRCGADQRRPPWSR